MLTAEEVEIVLLSLKVSCWSVGTSLPFAIATAYVLDRGRFFGKSLLDAIVHLPLVLPPVVVGYLRSSEAGRIFARYGFTPAQ